MRDLLIVQTKPAHRFAWLWEPLENDPTFVLRSMFGSQAIYLDGRIMLCFVANRKPWRGMLICTDRDHHPSLIESFPALTPFPRLAKWLYLNESKDAFETIAKKIVRLVRNRDPRIGVSPPPKKRRKSATPK